MKDSEMQSVKIVNVSFGERVKIIEPCNLYGCALGDDVFVGPFVEIQANVIIGSRSKIQSHSFVCELVSIGNDCFITMGSIVNSNLKNDSTTINKSTLVYESDSKINRILKKKYFNS